MSNEELVQKVQCNIDKQENMSQLWQQNLGMIRQIVRKHSYVVDTEDLMQESYIALSKATACYDPERGASFSTVLHQYLEWHFIQYCQNQEMIRISPNLTKTLREYRELVKVFQIQTGRKPTDWEVCHYLQISEKVLQAVEYTEQATQIGSIDVPAGENGETLVADLVADETDIEREVLGELQQKQLASVLWSMVDELPDMSAKVLKARYQDNMTLRNVADNIGISEKAAGQWLGKGIRELRKPGNRKKLEPFMDLEYTYSQALQGNGVHRFNQTWTSSTERIAIGLSERK